MRIIELYIKNKGKILKSLTINDLQNTERNNYLMGFSVNNNFSEFDIIYIGGGNTGKNEKFFLRILTFFDKIKIDYKNNKFSL